MRFFGNKDKSMLRPKIQIRLTFLNDIVGKSVQKC